MGAVQGRAVGFASFLVGKQHRALFWSRALLCLSCSLWGSINDGPALAMTQNLDVSKSGGGAESFIVVSYKI